jgi:ubiquinone/menaquinone biosynthesis C-methylase UbiE
MRSFLAKEYLKGDGIEIGGLNFPVPPHPAMHVKYVDRAPLEVIRRDHPDVKIIATDYVIDDGERLASFEDCSLDFLIANHVLEHCEKTLETLENWMRVLRVGGRAMVALPIASECFDRDRPKTTWQHLQEEFAQPQLAHNMDHYLDWYMNSEHEKLPPPEAEKRAAQAFADNQNIHFHCWNVEGITELFDKAQHYGWYKLLDLSRNGSEMIAILERV